MQYYTVSKMKSKEQDVRALVAEVINATGMKEEHMVDDPAIPITHVFVEFEDTRTRDRFVRSVNMRSYELDGRVIKISQALELDERFDKKRLGYIKYAINKRTGIKLYWIQLNLQKKSISINGQLVAKIENSGLLRYYMHEDVEDEVQNLMEKWLTKKLVATTREHRQIRRQKTRRDGKNSYLLQKQGQQESIIYQRPKRHYKKRKKKCGSKH